jgi:hypothetical protein
MVEDLLKGLWIKLNWDITAIIVKQATLAVGDLDSNETTFHCTMLW